MENDESKKAKGRQNQQALTQLYIGSQSYEHLRKTSKIAWLAKIVRQFYLYLKIEGTVFDSNKRGKRKIVN